MRNFFLFILFFPAFGICQRNNWLPGEVVYKDGNTVKGTIEYKSWVKNPSKIDFTPSDDSLSRIPAEKIISLFPAEVAEVRIAGRDVYYGAEVKRFINPLDLRDLTDSRGEQEVKEPVFLRLLIKGSPLSLFAYVDQIKTHYFILDSSGQWITLRYVKYMADAHIVENKIFRDQIRVYTVNNPKAEKTISISEWSDKEMIRIVKLINRHSDLSFAEEEQKYLRKTSGISTGVSAALINYQMSSSIELKNNFDFEQVYRPLIYGGYRFTGGRRLSKFAFQMIAGWYNYEMEGQYNWNSSGTPVTETMVIKRNNLFLGTDVMYNALPGKKMGVELGLDFCFNFPISASSLHTTTEINPSTGQPITRDQLRGFNARPYTVVAGVAQFRFAKKNNVRLMIIPYHRVTNNGSTIQRESLVAVGYHYLWSK